MASIPKNRPNVVQFKLTHKGVKASWSHVCKPIGKRSAERVARDLAANIDTRLELIRDGQLPVPAEKLASREALKAFVMGVDYALPAKRDTGGTLAKLVEDYLDERKLQVQTGAIKPSTFRSDRDRLDNFVEHCKKARSKITVAAVANGEFMGAYRDWWMKRVADGKRSASDAKHHLQPIQKMLKWARKRERIQSVPLVVDDSEWAKIPQPATAKPKVFTVEEIARIYLAANEQQRLWILLGLNCGWLQSDMATLTHDMLDWERGTIQRGRNKSGVAAEHKLWPLTLRKLREQATKPEDNELVLLNTKGNPLVQDTVDGQVCTISQAWRRLRRKAKVKLTFKYLRKTGASAIEKQFQDKPWLPTLYLAHEIAGPIRKFYTGQSFDELHAATDWLAGYFDFNEGGTLSGLGGSNSQ